MPSYGVSFLPGGTNTTASAPTPDGATPTQQAVKILSLRLPRTGGTGTSAMDPSQGFAGSSRPFSMPQISSATPAGTAGMTTGNWSPTDTAGAALGDQNQQALATGGTPSWQQPGAAGRPGPPPDMVAQILAMLAKRQGTATRAAPTGTDGMGTGTWTPADTARDALGRRNQDALASGGTPSWNAPPTLAGDTTTTPLPSQAPPVRPFVLPQAAPPPVTYGTQQAVPEAWGGASGGWGGSAGGTPVPWSGMTMGPGVAQTPQIAALLQALGIQS